MSPDIRSFNSDDNVIRIEERLGSPRSPGPPLEPPGGGDGGMEARIKRLEEDVKEIRMDVRTVLTAPWRHQRRLEQSDNEGRRASDRQGVRIGRGQGLGASLRERVRRDAGASRRRAHVGQVPHLPRHRDRDRWAAVEVDRPQELRPCGVRCLIRWHVAETACSASMKRRLVGHGTQACQRPTVGRQKH